VDSRGRLIITDPGSGGVHIFDFARRKYKFLYRPDSDKNPMLSPQCVALDSDDNIYVTDSKVGKVFVFDPNGKLRRVLGSLRGGEGYFKRPTGIAVDSSAHRIYITDTLRDSIFVMDSNGNVLDHFGGRGADDTHFNFPTEVLLRDHTLFIVDAMNFRVQLYENNQFRSSIGTPGEAIGEFFRPKGIAMDSEGHLYVVDAAQSVVQVFDRQGDLLFYFGGTGAELGNFRLPSGIFVDSQDRVYVVDSYNHRVQVFRYTAQPHSKSGDVR
jgi:DNA-binding beta-propeller fold protein YncE